jgi:hypothetical protein
MEVPEKLLKNVKAIQTGKIAEFAGVSKYTVNGALIGAGSGLIFSLLTGQSKLLFMAGGAIFGGFLANLISKKL